MKKHPDWIMPIKCRECFHRHEEYCNLFKQPIWKVVRRMGCVGAPNPAPATGQRGDYGRAR